MIRKNFFMMHKRISNRIFYIRFYFRRRDKFMKISGRNKLQATVKDVVKGAVMAKVVMDYKGDTLVSMITLDSVADLDLKPGDQVTALVKSTEMLVMK